MNEATTSGEATTTTMPVNDVVSTGDAKQVADIEARKAASVALLADVKMACTLIRDARKSATVGNMQAAADAQELLREYTDKRATCTLCDKAGNPLTLSASGWYRHLANLTPTASRIILANAARATRN